MVRAKESITRTTKPAPFNGTGEICVRDLLNGPGEMYNKARVFAHTTVYPGSAIGYHVHTNESETYYILKGTARFNDNGTEHILAPGTLLLPAAGMVMELKHWKDPWR